MIDIITADDTAIESEDEVILAGQKFALHVALVKKNTGLSNMYLGAHVVLRQQNNPEKHVQAVHSIREIIEKLPC